MRHVAWPTHNTDNPAFWKIGCAIFSDTVSGETGRFSKDLAMKRVKKELHPIVDKEIEIARSEQRMKRSR